MPKIKKNLNQVKYVSVADMYNNLDEIKSIDGKLAYATRYILNHDMSTTKDYSLSGAVHLARAKIAEAIKNNPKEKPSLAAQMFLGNPTEYIKGEANKLADQLEKADFTIKDQEHLKENCKEIAKCMNDEFAIDVNGVDEISKAIGVKARVEASLGGRKALEDTLKTAKTHKWYAIFSSSSKEWKALEAAYEDFQNPHNEKYCDFRNLAGAALDYFQHKFPGWGKDVELPENAFDKLNTSEKAKVSFAISVLKAANEQNRLDAAFHNLVDTSKALNIKYEDLPAQNKVIDLDQEEFANKIENDIKDVEPFNNAIQEDKVVKEKEQVKDQAPVEEEAAVSK
ncbi:MAG: hypothetical protein E7175_03760 [Erysipelotrichaceae bacterium]|nr:hypothetical protein [Erysipelotrichaceae bacterium]